MSERSTWDVDDWYAAFCAGVAFPPIQSRGGPHIITAEVRNYDKIVGRGQGSRISEAIINACKEALEQ